MAFLCSEYFACDDSFGIGKCSGITADGSDENLSKCLFPLNNSTLMLSAVSISFQFVSLLCGPIPLGILT